MQMIVVADNKAETPSWQLSRTWTWYGLERFVCIMIFPFSGSQDIQLSYLIEYRIDYRPSGSIASSRIVVSRILLSGYEAIIVKEMTVGSVTNLIDNCRSINDILTMTALT